MEELEKIDYRLIDNFVMSGDNSDISLVDVYRTQEADYGKFDKLVLSRYGKLSVDVFQKVLTIVQSFNNISDLTELKTGTIVRFPNIYDIVNKLIPTEVFTDDRVPGIAPMIPDTSGIQNKDKNKSNVVPKLNINLPIVSYNSESGTITY